MLHRIVDGLTQRRLGGAALVLAGIAVAAGVLLSAGGTSGGGNPAARGLAGVSVATLPRIGLTLAVPGGWDRRVDDRAVSLRSPEGSVLLTVTSPVSGRQPARVRQALEVALRRRFAPATVLREGPSQLGNRHGTSFELSGRSRGRPVRALGVIASTTRRTYAVTLVTSAAPSGRSLQEARAVLASIRLAKPVAARR